MRKLLISTALLLLCCSSLSAADATGDQWRISVLASEISTDNNDPWADDAQAGIGVGIAYAPTPQWDVELTVASQTHVSPYIRLFFTALPGQQTVTVYNSVEYRRYRVTPIDVSATRHFLVDGPIAPYVRAGIRYVGAPDDPAGPSFITPFPPVSECCGVLPAEGFHLEDRTSGQIGAGARIRLTPRTAIRAEVDRLIRSDKVAFDPLTRYALGLSWLF